MSDRVSERARAVFERVVEQRRDIHRHPELAYEEVRTSGKVIDWLRGLGLEMQTGIGKTGVVASLRGGKPGRTIALRADMDALPIQEATGHSFASESPGKMHACGHDAHTAMLLGVATVLAELSSELHGEVRFLFQPAEEGQGGAVPLIDSGALDGVDLVLGQHMAPFQASGTIGFSQGPAMAATDFFNLKIFGVGGHGAYPHLSVDTIPVAALVVTGLQSIVSRTVDPLAAAVVTIGTIRGGFRSNVIAPEVEMTGTVRTFDRPLREAMPQRIERIIKGVCEGHGARYELEYNMNYPPVINTAEGTQLIHEVARAALGDSRVMQVPPSMGGEDFAYYLEKVPGCFYWLGCEPKGRAVAPMLHSPEFDLDESAMLTGVEVMARAALTFLSR
jgi:amidohydrolase